MIFIGVVFSPSFNVRIIDVLLHGLSVHEHGIFLHWFKWSLMSLMSVLWSLTYKFCTCFVRFTLQYFSLSFFWVIVNGIWASQAALVVKNPPADAGDVRDSSLIPGSGGSPGGEHGNPLLYSCLENPMDRGAWRTTQSMGSQRVGHSWSNLELTHTSSLPNKQFSTVTPWILLSPGFRALICSETSIFWWIQDKSLIFSLFRFLLCD